MISVERKSIVVVARGKTNSSIQLATGARADTYSFLYVHILSFDLGNRFIRD